MLVSITEAEKGDIEAALLLTIKHAKECNLTSEAEIFQRTLNDFRNNVAIAEEERVHTCPK